jgi:gluconolactonase
MSELYEVLDERFTECFNPNARLEHLYQGCRWAEGPAYFPAGRYLVWSDIPNDRMLRYDETDESVSVFRQPAGYTNGHTVDRQGRLVSCEHGNRRVTRTEQDGSITVLADSYDGKPLNSPNDVVVRSDGSVWFSDPAYGIDSDLEGHKSPQEQDECFLFRISADGELGIAAGGFARPNGLAFSLDEQTLYVSDTGGPNHIRAFSVGDDLSLSGGEEFAKCTAGVFDGFRLDTEGRIWTSAGDGVHVYHPDGTLLGKVHVPEVVANVQFGWPKRNRLYMCGTTSLYAILLPVNGAKTF